MERAVRGLCSSSTSKLTLIIPSLVCGEGQPSLEGTNQQWLYFRRCEGHVDFSKAGYPPLLFAAVKSNNAQIVRVLLENGASPTAKYRGR